MFLSKTTTHTTSMNIEDIKKKLLGSHLDVHDLDFEVTDHGNLLKIIPHAEKINSIKTLPLTYIELTEKGSQTGVKIFTKIRKLDAGGPFIILIFCFILILIALGIFFIAPKDFITYAYAFGAIALGVFIIFMYKMETGYFDYSRKIRGYLKNQMNIS